MNSKLAHLRKRLGLTQAKLAEALGVEQGTVSRWERGIEKPWPSNLAKLRDLFMDDEGHRLSKLSSAMIRNNLLAACLTDSTTNLVEVSDLAVDHYMKLHGIDIRSQIGVSLEQHVCEMGNPAQDSLN